MPEENNIEKLKSQYPAFFEAYPLSLIEFALNKKTAQKIANICIENKITEQEKVEGVAFRVTYVLFDKLPKENLTTTLKDGLGIDEKTAQKIAKSVDEIIFSKLPSPTKEEPSEEKEASTEATEEKPPPKSPNSPQKDAYREPLA